MTQYEYVLKRKQNFPTPSVFTPLKILDLLIMIKK